MSVRKARRSEAFERKPRDFRFGSDLSPLFNGNYTAKPHQIKDLIEETEILAEFLQHLAHMTDKVGFYLSFITGDFVNEIGKPIGRSFQLAYKNEGEIKNNSVLIVNCDLTERFQWGAVQVDTKSKQVDEILIQGNLRHALESIRKWWKEVTQRYDPVPLRPNQMMRVSRCAEFDHLWASFAKPSPDYNDPTISVCWHPRVEKG
jgi:hypothetical protein